MATLVTATTGTVSGLANNQQINQMSNALATRSQGATAPTTTTTGLTSTAGLDWHDTGANRRKTRNQADTAWISEGAYDETNGMYIPQSDGPAGHQRAFQLLTAGTLRWQIDASTAPEGGSNAGSDMEIWRFTDGGASIGALMSANRASGATSWYASFTLAGNYPFVVGPNPNAGTGYVGFTVNTGGGDYTIGQGTSGVNSSLGMQRDTSGNYLTFYYHAFDGSAPTGIGSISTTGTSVAFNTTSDHRLKTVHGPAQTGALIDAVPVYDATMDGVRKSCFLAHELQAHAPWAVTGAKDATIPVGDVTDAQGATLRKGAARPASLPDGCKWAPTGTVPDYQMVDHSALVPMLWAEIQSLRKRVAALEAKKV